MSDPVVTDVPAVETPAAPAPKLTGWDKANSFLAAQAARQPAAAPIVPEIAPAQSAAVDEPEEAAVDAPPETPPPVDDSDIRKARAQQATIKQQRETYEAKQRAKKEAEQRAKVEEELTTLKSTVGSKDPKFVADLLSAFDSKDPKAVMRFARQHGMNLEDLAKVVLDEPDAPPPDPKDIALKTLEEKIAAIEKQRAEELAAAKAAAEKLEADNIYAQNLSHVSELLKAESGKYPAIASFPRAPAEIVRRFNAHVEQHSEPPDLDVLLAEFNQSVESDLDTILSGDAAFEAFLSRHSERALRVLKAKPSATSPASTEGESGQRKGAPTAITPTAAADAGARVTRPQTQTQESKIAAAMAELKRRSVAR